MNRVVGFFCVLLAAVPFSTIALGESYDREVGSDKPLAWWRFQESDCADGSAVKDEIAGHAGLYKGSVSLEAGPTGVGGRAAAFEGKGLVEIAHHKDFDLNELSVEFWFKSTQAWTSPYWPGSATLVAKSTVGNASSDWTILGGSARAGGRQGCVLAGSGPVGGRDEPTESPGKLNDGAWHHVVWTRSARGECRLYVDGGLTAALQDGGGSIANSNPFRVGGDRVEPGAKFLVGSIAELAVYGRVLDAPRVAAHATAGGLTPKTWPANIASYAGSQPPASTSGPQATAGWVKHAGNPVLGGELGTCFDVAVLREGQQWRMWLSWRPRKAVALSESADGAAWSTPQIVLAPNPDSGWEDDINRPGVVRRDGAYHMWYTGFNAKGSAIGYATSADGRTWKRMSEKPVLTADQPWEKTCVMCPHVNWDEQEGLYKMWYSGGERNEPDAIGYATSRDGVAWTKHPANPVFAPDRKLEHEKHKVTGAQIVKTKDGYVMFYIGFRDERTAQICLARSADGIGGWQRHWANPVIRPGQDQWDHEACYKPFAVFDGLKWMLWYNGRRGSLEQIGLAVHEGEDLGFDSQQVEMEAAGADAAAPATSADWKPGPADWTRFRGPRGDNISPAEPPAELTDVAWKLPVGGRGHSSPVVLDGKVFLTTAYEHPEDKEIAKVRLKGHSQAREMDLCSTLRLAAVCVDLASGRKLWEKEIFHCEKPDPTHQINSFATPTCTVEPGRLYCDFGEMGTACLDSGTGRILWKRRLKVSHMVGSGSSPILYRDLLILVRDGCDQQYIAALDKRTGKDVWKTPRPAIQARPDASKSFITPLMIETDGKTQMLATCAQFMVAYDPASGKELWRLRHSKGWSIAPGPAWADGVVYFCTGCLPSQLLAARTDGQGELPQSHVLWRRTEGVPTMPSPLLKDKLLYVLSDTGTLVCLDTATGEPRGRCRLSGKFLASPLWAAGRLYLANRDGVVTVLKADPSLEKLSEAKLDSAVSACPVAIGRSLLVRTEKHLYRIGK